LTSIWTFLRWRASGILGVAVAFVLLAPVVADAHAVVLPKTSVRGGYERYVLRVPNEKDVATTRVEIRFPRGLRVVSFADVPGWQLEVLTDSAKAIVGAVWTGTLLPRRFVEFPFQAANPRVSGRVTWPTIQTYAGGERVEWIGPEHSKTPASVTSIESAAWAGGGSVWLAGAAVLLSLVSLGLVMRRPRPI
jgi:hypothetical protein